MAWCQTGDQAIIWTNDAIVYWRIYASLCLNELTVTCDLVTPYCDKDDNQQWNDSGNGQLPDIAKTIPWPSAQLLSIKPLGTNFSEFFMKIKKLFY